ncbi:transposase [Candidatus Microgenomates bacterium]|nr:transposase [Candidatus Microgenomates bacterium]
MTRGNNLNTIFKQNEDYHKYLEIVGELKEIHPFDIYHYCLMPNHTHFLIKTNNESDYSSFMKNINLIYFYYYKKKYGWIGHFWQDRFKSQPIGKDEYFIQCGKYIELNPVRASIIGDPEEYPYSSYKYYSEGKLDLLITEDLFFREIGKTPKERQQKYKDIAINDIIMDTYKKKVWGSREQRYNEHRKIRYHNY